MKKKIIASIAIFAVLISVCGLCTSRILGEKSSSGINQIARIYDLPEDSIDVLFLGTSHVWTSTQPALLWDEYGIAAYDLCAARQTTWHTYYYLKEALKYQSPKMVVLDTFGVGFDYDYDASVGDLACSLYGMRFSPDKVKNLMAGMPRESRIPYLLEYIQYHKRYAELTPEDYIGLVDYTYVGGDLLGNPETTYVQPFEDKSAVIDTYDKTKITPINAKSEEYLYKIIDLCKQNDIELVFVSIPSGGYNESACWMDNYIAEIADNEGIEFYQYVYESREMGIDWSHDMMDNTHLNFWGGQKYTRYMAQTMLDNYDLPDHRLDGTAETEKYEHWNYCADEYNNQETNYEIINSNNLEELISAIEQRPEGYYVAIQMVTAEYPEIADIIIRYMDNHGIQMEAPIPNSVCLIKGDEVELVIDGYKQIDITTHEITFDGADGKIYFDGKSQECSSAGMTISVFDAYTGAKLTQMGYSMYRNGK